jgi:3-methyladenine DNA glycosylase AlkC
MAAPFKDRIDAAMVRLLAARLGAKDAAFDAAAFAGRATAGLGPLALKQRVGHVAAALAATLPDDFAAACGLLEATLAPARVDDDLAALAPGPDGLAGWVVWPMTEFVARRGLAAPARALQALHAMTQRFTAEFALRPFLVAHEALTLRTLGRWVRDPSPHVRRLVSEGSRPRLPWGTALPRFVADPSPTLPLLAALQDDASAYVRRSVANHLNDIAKDHPDVVVDWLRRHLPGAPGPRRALLQRASRTLEKRGEPGALAAWGVDAAFRGEVAFAVAPARAAVGGAMALQVELRAAATGPAQRLVIDYIVRGDGDDAHRRRKVWRGWRVELAPGEARALQKRHSWRPTTVRVDRPGRKRVELRINGRAAAQAAFTLTAG